MKGEQLTIASQNVRGLGHGFLGSRKRKELKDIFKQTTPATDILLLQETKISENASLKQARFIEFRGGSSLWNEATFSAQTARYTGGTGIILSEKLSTLVVQHGVLYPGRAQYVILQLSPHLKLGILNVYGFSDTGPRAMLWNHLAQVELPEADWILAGDFNNIEQASDKQGGSSKTNINPRELESWNRLLMRLRVSDVFHLRAFNRRSNKIFTWSNGRNDHTMIQSRIDRLYAPPRIEYIGGTLEVLPTLSDISDHAGVVMHFNNEGKRRTPTPYFNKGLLANPEHKAALLVAWKTAMDNPTLDSWNQKVVAANHAIRLKSAELTKAQKQKWRDTYLAQFEDIINAEAELQNNWGSKEARDKLSDAQAAIHEVRQQKFQFQESAILSKWARVGDRCTKEFFEHHAGHRQPTPIKQLKDGERIISNQGELEAHILQFYKDLYTRDENVESNDGAREDCFRYLQRTVTAEHNSELLKPITPEEVSEAVKQLPTGKAPGVDTIPAEFYQEVWDDIEFDIYNFVSETIDKAYISADLNISKIALLPKSDDRTRIQNYRPISLLNTLYKVVAKIYANRMKPLLHNWILPSQTGFVPNRCILDNIFLAFEAIEWALENNQNLSMLLLDFEKAYDRVSWKFLSQAMDKMGFNSNWITQVMSLNLNASASIIVNGEQSKPFQLQRSVRQGCPLAPYLFLLTVDVLGQMLQHPECNVQGLRLPDHSTITNQMFADDTLLLLEGNPANMDRAINVINRFGAASGAKLNLHKSIGLWISHTERAWSWGEDTGLKWLAPGEVTRYLGYPFGIRISQKEKDTRMLGQIRKHLHRWAGNKLSLAGRIMVSNQVILSSIWYLASCTDLSGSALKLARATVRNYIWSGRRESCARARVKWATAVLPIVRGGVKTLDPQWQASALLVKLLLRGMTAGYEPWKVLVRYRVEQTQQSRSGRWPAHANWIMNSSRLVKKGSTMWQGVMKAWGTIQSGLEQQDPTSWSEIMRQPLYGNRFLTNTEGIQWGTTPRSNMILWATKHYHSLKDIASPGGQGWSTFPELSRLQRARTAPPLYTRVLRSIPWQATPMPLPTVGQWVAGKESDGSIQNIYYVSQTHPTEATLYHKGKTERLHLISQNNNVPAGTQEVRIIRTESQKHLVIDYNPSEDIEDEQELWLWGNDWISNLTWDPKEWNWRRIGALPITNILNYTTKRGYRVALKQDNHQMPVDAELEANGMDSKTRAKFFNRIWHPHLPRKVSAMQWLVLTEGLPVGAWRERIGLRSDCQLCPGQVRETLQHAFLDCEEVKQAWVLFRKTRQAAGLPPDYSTWVEVSRGKMTDPPGPRAEEELQWDTAAAFSINLETPWDILRAQLLWAIWCQRVAHAFSEDHFHLGVVIWHAWRNTIYCAMEAYKELFRHKRNEEKRQEMITCFEQIWTAASIFGRRSNTGIKWNTTPHPDFLPKELGAWITPPIRIHRNSPSPDVEAEFMAQEDFQEQVHAFVNGIGNNWNPAASQENHTATSTDPTPDTPVTPAPNRSEENLHTHTTLGSSQEPVTSLQRENTEDSISSRVRCHTGLQPQDEPNHLPAQHTHGDIHNEHPTTPRANREVNTDRDSPPQNQHSGPLEETLRHNRQGGTESSYPATSVDQQATTLVRSLYNSQTDRTKENCPPRPRSRPKIKCGFGPRRNSISASMTLTDTHRASDQPSSHRPSNLTTTQQRDDTYSAHPGDRSTELEDLLHEIELTRTYNPEPDEGGGQLLTRSNPLRTLAPPKSRPKTKCRFGPTFRRGQTHMQSPSTPYGDDLPPPAAPDRLPFSQSAPSAEVVRHANPLTAPPTTPCDPGAFRANRTFEVHSPES